MGISTEVIDGMKFCIYKRIDSQDMLLNHRALCVLGAVCLPILAALSPIVIPAAYFINRKLNFFEKPINLKTLLIAFLAGPILLGAAAIRCFLGVIYPEIIFKPKTSAHPTHSLGFHYTKTLYSDIKLELTKKEVLKEDASSSFNLSTRIHCVFTSIVSCGIMFVAPFITFVVSLLNYHEYCTNPLDVLIAIIASPIKPACTVIRNLAGACVLRSLFDTASTTPAAAAPEPVKT